MQIISHRGKAICKFKGCWNTQENEDEPVKCIDFKRDVQGFKMLDEPNLDSVEDNLSDSMQTLEINLSEVLHNSIKTETGESKQKELASWIQDVYKEVPNEGQKTISTYWAVSPKVIDGVMSTKACLLARGFKEKEVQTIRSDSSQ